MSETEQKDPRQKLEKNMLITHILFLGDQNPISPERMFGAEAGEFVSVRPVGDEKTYLGIMLGDYAPPAVGFRIAKEDAEKENPEATVVISKGMGNPAMWVPDLKRVVMGWGSWWGPIRREEDLHQITDVDIQNVWYVKALKALTEKNSEPVVEPAETE
jgi:hypothetical protein